MVVDIRRQYTQMALKSNFINIAIFCMGLFFSTVVAYQWSSSFFASPSFVLKKWELVEPTPKNIHLKTGGSTYTKRYFFFNKTIHTEQYINLSIWSLKILEEVDITRSCPGTLNLYVSDHGSTNVRWSVPGVLYEVGKDQTTTVEVEIPGKLPSDDYTLNGYRLTFCSGKNTEVTRLPPIHFHI